MPSSSRLFPVRTIGKKENKKITMDNNNEDIVSNEPTVDGTVVTEIKYYATLGQRYRREPHPVLENPDPDGVIGIAVSDIESARSIASSVLGRDGYSEVEAWDDTAISEYYPHGITAVISEDGRLAELRPLTADDFIPLDELD